MLEEVVYHFHDIEDVQLLQKPQKLHVLKSAWDTCGCTIVYELLCMYVHYSMWLALIRLC